jgi:anti-anti-sigma regulatory factor
VPLYEPERSHRDRSLQVLLMACERTRRLGGTPALAALQRSPARVVEITGIAAAFPVHPPVEEPA